MLEGKSLDVFMNGSGGTHILGNYIVCAAIRVGEMIMIKPRPNRHHDIISEYNCGNPCGHEKFKIVQPEDQGFIDMHGNFVSRKTAYKMAFFAKQIDKPYEENAELFSEDLW